MNKLLLFNKMVIPFVMLFPGPYHTKCAFHSDEGRQLKFSGKQQQPYIYTVTKGVHDPWNEEMQFTFYNWKAF